MLLCLLFASIVSNSHTVVRVKFFKFMIYTLLLVLNRPVAPGCSCKINMRFLMWAFRLLLMYSMLFTSVLLSPASLPSPWHTHTSVYHLRHCCAWEPSYPLALVSSKIYPQGGIESHCLFSMLPVIYCNFHNNNVYLHFIYTVSPAHSNWVHLLNGEVSYY